MAKFRLVRVCKGVDVGPYRNVQTGDVVEFTGEDAKNLETSDLWERVEETPKPKPKPIEGESDR